MPTLVFLGVAIITAYKVSEDVQVDPPFEWLGEVFTAVVSFAVAAVAAFAVYLAL